MKKQQAMEALDAAFKLAKEAGINIVCVAATYTDKHNAHFSTKLSVTAVPELHVTDDHIILDALREITNNWSEVVHKVEPRAD